MPAQTVSNDLLASHRWQILEPNMVIHSIIAILDEEKHIYVHTNSPSHKYVFVLYHQLNPHTSITKVRNAFLTNFK